MDNSFLFNKVFGSVAASNIGSAMGAAVEWVSVPGGGWPALEEHFGWVEELLPWEQKDRDVRYWNNSPPLHYYHMDMEAGMTEDGAEIRYLLELAMLEKGGRITVDDLAEVWKREIKREHIGRLVNPHIIIHFDRLTAGDARTRVPPRLIGSMTPWPGLVDAAHMIGPVGIINACNPRQAALDTEDICLLLQPPASGGIEASKVIAAAAAEAFRPSATVESVVDASKAYVSINTRDIVDEALEIARKHPDIKDVREPIRKHFAPTYPYADAVETAAEAMALFWITQGGRPPRPHRCHQPGPRYGLHRRHARVRLRCLQGRRQRPGRMGRDRSGGHRPQPVHDAKDVHARHGRRSCGRGAQFRARDASATRRVGGARSGLDRLM